MTAAIDTDYLVIGAGAMGMAFTDALIDHADMHVTIVDRRHAPGGHWQDAYGFVRLHQASEFYGVASTLMGTRAVQRSGPEMGLRERAGLSEILAYYDRVMQRFVDSGMVTFLAGTDHRVDGDDNLVTSSVSGATMRVNVRRRVVDASYLSPAIPSRTPAPFPVAEGVRLATVNQLTELPNAPSSYVIVGSGKTATDAIVWLLNNGVDPERIIWVRPRDPWMLNRAIVQPNPGLILGMGADIMEAAAASQDVDEMFLRLEEAGLMLRIDRSVAPTMARAPTLGMWELDLLKSVRHVVRMGHIRGVRRNEIDLVEGSVPIPDDAMVVHCAGSGLQNPTLVPIWGEDRIRLRTIRAGFPCFGAALTGYVEATRDDDRARNRLCPPNVYGNTLASWAEMQLRGARATATFMAEPDIAEWANHCALNPARVLPEHRNDPGVVTASSRIAAFRDRAMTQLSTFAQDPPTR